MKRCLVHLYSPPYLLSALAALATLHPEGRVAVTLFVQLPGASAQTLAELLEVVRELAEGHPFIEQIGGCTDDELGTRQPTGPFDEFYYAHDLTGSVCRVLAAANPRARRICIGDAFGMLYTDDYMDRYRQPLALRERIRAWFRPLSDKPPPLRPDLAALVLPVDPSGRALRKTPLVVCRKEAFLDAIRRSHANSAGLREHMRAILSGATSDKRYLLLTENYGDAGHLSPAREIEMYAEIARRHCEPESVIIVKPHPLETPGKAARLAQALAGSHAVVAVDRRFARYPVEIWLELLRSCTVLCMAYPMLSLKYAHNIDVVQPMDEAFVERWIEPDYRKWVRDSLRLYLEPLRRLASWDGRGPLWEAGS